ncbi:DNA repair metallo-beta-lactamase [Penicillium soppii]|uniref:DNA repair metallo-beta-lactamase n=1 Tax=Penicillium soppii TaxID=69789 RepID=UPI0025479F71|nr:DNA repair metallo-beta-lactamase [Penicillium soppii]KAJ5874945.1 DNA repair metallo-beta-lactamase [Penicillium soppii]
MAGPYAKKATTPSKPSFGSKQSSTKRNTSILSFFQKTDTPPGAVSRQARITQFGTASTRSPSNGRGTPTFKRAISSKSEPNGDLFLEDKKGLAKLQQAKEAGQKARSPTPDIWGDDEEFLKADDEKYNEGGSAIKRRKVDSPSTPADESQKPDTEPKTTKMPAPTKARSGPFIDESDSEDDMVEFREIPETQAATTDLTYCESFPTNKTAETECLSEPTPPPSVSVAMSNIDNDEHTNFDEIEEDELIAEELRNRPWEAEEQDQEIDLDIDPENDNNDCSGMEEIVEDRVSTTCPICQAVLKDVNETEITMHVNDCLDGKSNTAMAAPLTRPISTPSLNPVDTNKGLTRAERAAIARPAQRDPYSQPKPKGRSAFSKMMAGNAEDTAWNTAAANEVSSRGKQAYQRTCPFYKILPGFSICVDAFRYGAVEGCNAYFLSHFHSDHYIGLSKSWCHGPIYCSRPTANLVRQQLRVDPKWVVDLEFETTFEVPGTGGVQVTMLHANHCPGSSLFLFEKTVGSGPSAHQQRVLHCGDFRASPAQVQHPLLRPNVTNPVTGKPTQQHINTCYLDTTYLNPKYGFPCQEDVITACSELCVRLNQEAGVGIDIGKNGTGQLMNKFLSNKTGNNKAADKGSQTGGRLLVVIGTYSIGKERICMGIARALGSKIFATPPKQRICACLEDPELTAMLTTNPREAQVHMQTLFEIRADTLSEYLDGLKPHFSRVVGFRPTGWTYRPPAGRVLQNPPVSTVLHGDSWKSPFTIQDLTPQRGSTKESACYGVPYSEHSSFRELTMFCCALRIGRVIPTVNVGSQKSRDQMKVWMERWDAEKKKNGLFPVTGDRW